MGRRRKRMKLFGKRKYFLVEEKKNRRRRRQIFGEGRYQCLWVKIRTEKEGKEGKIWRRNFVGRQVDRRTSKVLLEVLAHLIIAESDRFHGLKS